MGMMANLEDGGDLDINTAQETLKLLEQDSKKSKKKKKNKEKLPAPFAEEPLNLDELDLDNLPPDLLEEINNYEPTEEEIAAEFELLKKQEEEKKRKKDQRKKKEAESVIRDEDGSVLKDETGKELRMDDPALL